MMIRVHTLRDGTLLLNPTDIMRVESAHGSDSIERRSVITMRDGSRIVTGETLDGIERKITEATA